MFSNLHYIQRCLEPVLRDRLDQMPAVALLGPRQCGKSTLAKHVICSYPSVYLDLERPSDLRKLTNPELFLEAHGDEVVCLDEIQRAPELFPVLRNIIDVEGRNTRFIILGSASFYRTAKGEEVDLVLQKGTKRILVECQAGDAPGISRSLRVAIHDLVPEHTYIVAPVTESYPLDKKVTIHSLHSVLRDERLQAFFLR